MKQTRSITEVQPAEDETSSTVLGNLARILFRVATVALAVGLVWYTIRMSDADVMSSMLSAHKGYLLGAVLAFGATLAVGILRWLILLRALDIRLGVWRATRLYMIGTFFNLLLPGAVTGDAVKIAYLTRNLPKKRTEAVLTIFLDRFLGVYGIYSLALAAVAIYWSDLRKFDSGFAAAQTASWAVGIGGAGLLGLTLLVAILWFIPWTSGISKLFGTSDSSGRDAGAATAGARHGAANEKKSRSARMLAFLKAQLARCGDALRLYSAKPLVLVAAVGLSIAMHFFHALSLYCAGWSVSDSFLDFGECILISSVCNSVAAIPITPAGIGARDMLTATFLTAFGVTGAAVSTTPLIVTFSVIICSLIGGLIFLTTE